MKDGKPWLPEETKEVMNEIRQAETLREKLEKFQRQAPIVLSPLLRGAVPLPSTDTNPKDSIGATKLSMSLVPTSGIQAASLAFLEGALKYGRYNWRVAGVRTSIYMDAIWRHLDKYWNGEYADPVTRVPHLASVLACVMIIIDADRMGKLTDDRPPVLPSNSLRIDDAVDMVAHLKELFKDHHPHQYTIADVASNAEDSCPST